MSAQPRGLRDYQESVKEGVLKPKRKPSNTLRRIVTEKRYGHTLAKSRHLIVTLERGDVIRIREKGRSHRSSMTATIEGVFYWMLRNEAAAKTRAKAAKMKATRDAYLARKRQERAEAKLFKTPTT